MFQCLHQQGVKVKAKAFGDGIQSQSLDIKLDAMAGRANAMRRGTGRIIHIATPTLWLQRLVINDDIKMTRIGLTWEQNISIASTRSFCGMRFSEGWSKIAPKLEFFSTTIPVKSTSPLQKNGYENCTFSATTST